jgi:hypothetical protein
MNQYDLQLKTEVDLSALLSQYSCHQVCVSCFGPSFTSCDEFFPLIELHSTTTLTSTQSLSFTKGDRAFRGRAYDTISEYALTGWFQMKSANRASIYCELLRISNTA